MHKEPQTMDFNKFDNRARAEQGYPLQLLDPETREPLTHQGKPCLVYIRGTISSVVQGAIRQKLKEQVVAENRVIVGESPEAKALRKTPVFVMEDVHKDAVETTIPYVIRLENIPRGAAVLESTSEDDIRWLLNLTFPVVKQDKDSDGNLVFEDGEGGKRPKLSVVNLPFTKQIQDAASDLGTTLGNDPTA
jgi:hypothetical protein